MAKRKFIDDGKMINKIYSLYEYQLSMSRSLSTNSANKAKISRGAANIVANYFSEYIDSMARSNKTLDHVYENNRAGDKNYRLFVKNIGQVGGNAIISFSFKSAKLAEDSGYVFKYRAEMMEKGGPITIRPTTRQYLSFKLDSGETIFSKEVFVKSIGGIHNNAFENEFNSFMNKNSEKVLLDSKYFDRIIIRMKERNELYIPRLKKASISDAKSQGQRDASYISRESSGGK